LEKPCEKSSRPKKDSWVTWSHCRRKYFFRERANVKIGKLMLPTESMRWSRAS
jgi:hypothetical protein